MSFASERSQAPSAKFRIFGAAISGGTVWMPADRKSTRLNSSHSQISYAVFCLKKKENRNATTLGQPEMLGRPLQYSRGRANAPLVQGIAGSRTQLTRRLDGAAAVARCDHIGRQ